MNVKTELMAFFAAQFKVTTVDGQSRYVLTGTAPTWCREVLKACQGNNAPDNFRRRTMALGADSLSGIEPDQWSDEGAGAVSDALVNDYLGNLLTWLSSSPARVERVNEAVRSRAETFDAETFDLFDVIRDSQHSEIRETLGALIQEIEGKADEAEPWAAGSNMAGYMPDSDPATFAVFGDALDCVREELIDLAALAYDAGETEKADEYHRAANYAERQENEFCVIACGRAFWVTIRADWKTDI